MALFGIFIETSNSLSKRACVNFQLFGQSCQRVCALYPIGHRLARQSRPDRISLDILRIENQPCGQIGIVIGLRVESVERACKRRVIRRFIAKALTCSVDHDRVRNRPLDQNRCSALLTAVPRIVWNDQGRRPPALRHIAKLRARLHCEFQSLAACGWRRRGCIHGAFQECLARIFIPFEPAGCDDDPARCKQFKALAILLRFNPDYPRAIAQQTLGLNARARFNPAGQTGLQEPRDHRLPKAALLVLHPARQFIRFDHA